MGDLGGGGVVVTVVVVGAGVDVGMTWGVAMMGLGDAGGCESAVMVVGAVDGGTAGNDMDMV